MLGSFLLGVVMQLALATDGMSPTLRLTLSTGVLGGFTTFSSFSLDVVTMAERGAPGLALGYILVSVIGSIAALFAGLSAVRAVA